MVLPRGNFDALTNGTACLMSTAPELTSMSTLCSGIIGIMKGLIETARSIDVRVVTVAPYFVSKCRV